MCGMYAVHKDSLSVFCGKFHYEKKEIEAWTALAASARNKFHGDVRAPWPLPWGPAPMTPRGIQVEFDDAHLIDAQAVGVVCMYKDYPYERCKQILMRKRTWTSGGSVSGWKRT